MRRPPRFSIVASPFFFSHSCACVILWALLFLSLYHPKRRIFYDDDGGIVVKDVCAVSALHAGPDLNGLWSTPPFACLPFSRPKSLCIYIHRERA